MNLYLSRHRVRCAVGQTLRCVEINGSHDADVLLAAASELLRPRCAVRMHLSAGLCPSVGVNYPKGIVTYAERLAFAKSSAASQLGLPAADLVVEFDPKAPELVAVMHKGDRDKIIQWCRKHEIRLRSVCPFWAEALAVPARRRESFVLVEPDAITALHNNEGRYTTLACTLDDPAHASTALQRMSTALGAAEPRRGLQYVDTTTRDNAWRAI